MVSTSKPKPRATSKRARSKPQPQRPNEEVLALVCAEAAYDKKAEEVVVLDLRTLSSFTDYFVICSGNSEPQIKAIADEIQEKMREKHHLKALRVDGFPMSQWVVVDFGAVLVHIFHAAKRAHYALEDLWNDAPRIETPPHPA